MIETALAILVSTLPLIIGERKYILTGNIIPDTIKLKKGFLWEDKLIELMILKRNLLSKQVLIMQYASKVNKPETLHCMFIEVSSCIVPKRLQDNQ